jgi:glyoxylase-like metal-dependent hydrolase (beta-lactamase superfamily II)
VAAKGRKVTDIFITHGHGDHWFTAAMLADRFGARVVATAGTITQMRASAAGRAAVFDKVYQGIPPTAITAVTVPGDGLALEGHDLVIHEVGHSDTDHSSVLHVPDLALVVAGDVIYNGAHMWLGESAAAGNFNAWRSAIDQVEALEPRHIVCGHQNKQLDDDAERTIAETRQYLDDADDLLRTEQSSLDFFNAKIARYPEHLGRTVLWATARALYAEREHPGEDVAMIRRTVWL